MRTNFPSVDTLSHQPEMPDPFTFLDGRRIESPRQWWDERRSELLRLFQHYMYGFSPPAGRATGTILCATRTNFGGKGTLQVVNISVDGLERPIQLLLALPDKSDGPVPVFLGISFHGIHSLVEDTEIPIPTGWVYGGPGIENNRASSASRGIAQDVWNLPLILERGYGAAVFYNGDVEPDVAGTTDGIRARLHGEVPPGNHDWGAIAAWAWGIQRVVDYLVTRPEVDADRIAVVGHSRNGKAAIVAGAFDERIALAIPLQAGCGGTAPSRGKVGESVRQINSSFPHWFCETFKEFNDRPERLPFDQNGLVALMAPRPVLFSAAVEDTWANPEGQFEVLRRADPVYRFLGVAGLESSEMPEPGRLSAGRLGYFLRPGSHSMTTEDWNAFLNYADIHLMQSHGKREKQA